MNLRTSLIPTLALMVLNPIVSTIKAPTTKLTSENDNITALAAKYESPTIDISSINFENYQSDIQSSSISQDINDGVSTNFEIDKRNTTGVFLWYNDVHGQDMRDAYNSKIESDTVTMINYLPILSLISQVAHYYGDNATMNPYIRLAAISKDISVLIAAGNDIKSKLSNIADTSTGIFAQIFDWVSNYNQIVDWVVNKDYDKCLLLSEFNSINYDSLTSSYNNLHNAEDFLCLFTGDQWPGWYNVSDYFHVNTNNGHYFNITYNSVILFGIRDFVVYHVWDFTFSDPNDFNIDFI